MISFVFDYQGAGFLRMLVGGKVQVLWLSGLFFDESYGMEFQGLYEVGKDILMIVGRDIQGVCIQMGCMRYYIDLRVVFVVVCNKINKYVY